MLALAPRSDFGVRKQEKACERAGIKLRKAIWDPVWKVAGGTRRVFLIPDGSLDQVSFDALPSDNGRFMAEESVIFHYLSARRDLLRADSVGALASGMLAFGVPDFDHLDRGADASPIARLALAGDAGRRRGGELPCAELASSKFQALPNAAPGPGGAAVLLLGPFATEGAFKKLAPGRRIIHVATHAFFQDESCMPRASASRGSPPEPNLRPIGSPTGGRVDPLLLSGLVLAGANRRDSLNGESKAGMLTAEEIGALDLTGTEWLVLSACGTNLGRM